MELFYFTFGQAHKFAGYCQPIIADNYLQAEQVMFMNYGKKFAFGYSEKEFNSSRFTKRLKHLPTIYAKGVMQHA